MRRCPTSPSPSSECTTQHAVVGVDCFYIALFSTLEQTGISVCALSSVENTATVIGPLSLKSCTSGSLLLSLPSKANSRHFSSQNISVKPHCPSLLSVCTVCVCVCVCVRIFCIVMLEPLSIPFSFFFFFFFITFSISMYIMCVCLFSTLSRRVGALQISIIIIKWTGGGACVQVIS